MQPRVVAAFVQHDNLLTRRQALGHGITIAEIDRWVRADEWVDVRRGVYALREFWEGLDERTGRPLYVARAASAAMRTPHVMSHHSAGLEHGLDLLLPDPQLVHVTRPGVCGSRTEHGVKHHKAPYRPEQVVVVNGRRVLDPARTAVDIAREEGLGPGLVAADAVLRAGVSRQRLVEAAGVMWSWPHVTCVREVVDLADAGAENPFESLGRLLVTELGQGRPQTQFGLTDGRRQVWCDLRIGRHMFELDGYLKYLSRADGGVADIDPQRVLWEEKKRQDFICGFKLGMSRIVWADLWGPARVRARERLLREYLDTLARFGDSIADLEPYLLRGPRRQL